VPKTALADTNIYQAQFNAENRIKVLSWFNTSVAKLLLLLKSRRQKTSSFTTCKIISHGISPIRPR